MINNRWMKTAQTLSIECFDWQKTDKKTGFTIDSGFI